MLITLREVEPHENHFDDFGERNFVVDQWAELYVDNALSPFVALGELLTSLTKERNRTQLDQLQYQIESGSQIPGLSWTDAGNVVKTFNDLTLCEQVEGEFAALISKADFVKLVEFAVARTAADPGPGGGCVEVELLAQEYDYSGALPQLPNDALSRFSTAADDQSDNDSTSSDPT